MGQNHFRASSAVDVRRLQYWAPRSHPTSQLDRLVATQLRHKNVSGKPECWSWIRMDNSACVVGSNAQSLPVFGAML